MDNMRTGKFCRLIPIWGIRWCCQFLTGAEAKHHRISFIEPSVQEWHHRAIRRINWEWEERTAVPYRNTIHLVICEVISCLHTSALLQPLLQAVLELAGPLAGTTIFLWLLLVHVYVVHWAQQHGGQVLYFIKRHTLNRNNPVRLLVCTKVQFCMVTVVEKWIKRQVHLYLVLNLQTLWKHSMWLQADL